MTTFRGDSNLQIANNLVARHGWKLLRAFWLAERRVPVRRRLHHALDEQQKITGLKLSCLWDDSLCFCGEPWWLRNVLLELMYKDWMPSRKPDDHK